jgi:hypothetical protein
MEYDRFYQLKLSLLGIKPEIWRRIVVPASISLDRLHDVIQIVMPWEDVHLYEFQIGKDLYSAYADEEDGVIYCGGFRLGDLVKQKGRKFLYRYDFGDGWEVELTVENSRFPRAALFCLEGERTAPPEDIGGIPGYENLLRTVKMPADEEDEEFEKSGEFKELLEWLGGEFDPEFFNSDATNFMLDLYLNWSQDRPLDWGPVEWIE